MANSSMELELVNENELIQPSLTWFVNRETKSLGGEIDGIDAVRQAVNLQLDTMRFGYEIMDADYGSELNTLIGKTYNYIVAELPRIVTDCLLRDDRVLAVSVTNIEKVSFDSLRFDVIVTSIFGYITQEGVELEFGSR